MRKEGKKLEKKLMSGFVVVLMLMSTMTLLITSKPVLGENESSGDGTPSLRIYGEANAVYPTHSYYGSQDFVYPKEYDPFDPGIIEKDSITFNPAFWYGHDEYEIKAQGDASEKVFLRAFYEPGYWHPVDTVMDDCSDVILKPVEQFDAIVTETTYFLVTLDERDPTVGYPGATKVVLPYVSLDPMKPGMDEAALLDVVRTNNRGTTQLTDGAIAVEKMFEFDNIDYTEDITIRFMDHKVTIVNFEDNDPDYDKLDLDVSYVGNMDDAVPATETHTIWEDHWGYGFEYYFDRENHKQAFTDPCHRWYLRIDNADDDYLRISLGRVLVAGETFYVDGVRYDMPAIYVDGPGGFKYITFQSPIPKGYPVWTYPLSDNVDDFSHVTSQYLASLPPGEAVWVLPPFDREHLMVDDIGLEKYTYACSEVPPAGLLIDGEKDALEFYYIDETIEERFDTSLAERLNTDRSGEEWFWYNVYTRPNQYTEFVLPDQETTSDYYYDDDIPHWYPYYTADGNEYLITSSFIAPNSNVDTDRSDFCKTYDEHEIFDRVVEIALFNERIEYYELPRFVFEFDASNPIDFYINEGSILPSVRIYGEEDAFYPTHSYSGQTDFIYSQEYDPFDPGIIEKDSITFNPAFWYGHDEYEIKAQGDASEKVFLRAFYEPGYWHPVDTVMDDCSDVILKPVEQFDAIVTETTYFLVTLDERDPTVGYPGATKVVLPYVSLDPMKPGMDEAALLDVAHTDNMNTFRLTDGSIAVEKEYEIIGGSYIGRSFSFMDHKVTIVNFEDNDPNEDKLDIKVSYVGNMDEVLSSTTTHTLPESFWGYHFPIFFDRDNNRQFSTDPCHRWYLRIINADDDYLRIVLGRVLVAGETFYVDGVRYDMPAIYVNNTGGFKYITFQSPIPKGYPVWTYPLSKNVDDFSHVTSQYLASLPPGEAVWVLPPFDREHLMIDDIGIKKYNDGCIKVPPAGLLIDGEKDALEFYYIDETIEERFDTSLAERLNTDKSGEEWFWYNVYTRPNQYTEFVLPDQETTSDYYYDDDIPHWYPYYTADGDEYLITSSLIAPNCNMDTDRSDFCKTYDEHEIFSKVDNGNGGSYGAAQLAMILDGSGSINPSEWAIMKDGLADAIRTCFPHDGTVELTVIQFAGDLPYDAQVEVGPVVVTAANYESVATAIEGIVHGGGDTPLAAGIDLATVTLAPTAGSYTRQLINIVTDGAPNVGDPDGKTAAENARDNMIATLGFVDGEDEIDAEGVGISQSNIEWLRDKIVWPQPGYDDWPPAGPGWVREVSSYTEFSATVCEKFGFLFESYVPRVAFEFDAYDGTGLYINENGQPPTADANGPYYGECEQVITFDGSGSYDNDEGGASIVQYDWKFYDGDTWHNDLGPYPTHVYSSEGTYTVTLRVWDDEGATDTDTTSVYISCGSTEEDPTADAGGPYYGECEQVITFDGSGSYDNDEGGASIVQYDWKFYDGDTWHNDLGPYPTHVYSSEGTYTVTLRVWDDEGATDTDTALVYITEGGSTGAVISMENVFIPCEGSEYGYLQASNVADDVGSCQIDLSWDPTVVSVVSIDDSEFDTMYYYLDNAAGTLSITAFMSMLPLTGDFDIARITFEAVGSATASCDIVIEYSELLTDDPTPSDIPHTTVNGAAYVDCGGGGDNTGDMNGDGKVDSGDVRYLALYLAGDPTYSPLHANGDVNNDGDVDSGDVRYLALYLAGDPTYSPLYPEQQ